MTKQYLEKVFSSERMQKFFDTYKGDETKAITHYQCNIQISEAFYSSLSIFEVALRNAVNRELITKFGVSDWYNHFPSTPGLGGLMKDISNAQSKITKRKELVNPSKVVAELTLGFWVRLFNVEYELILWKDLRRAFPYMPKEQRKRKNISAPLNDLRNLRNRIFHNEPICWNLSYLHDIHQTILVVSTWINKDMPGWISQIDRFDNVLADVYKKIRS